LKCRCGSIVRNLEKGRRQKWRREGKEVQGDEEEFVESAEDEQNRLEGINNPCKLQQQGSTYLVRIVQIQEVASAFVDILMTRCRSSHDQGRIHVNVVACQVQGDKSLENNSPARPGRRQEHQEARGGASISHHIEYSAESS
jgi:hypothetical protein